MAIEVTTRPSRESVFTRPVESSQSGVSWAAILAGATTSAAVSLILLAAGSAMGLASLSLAPGSGASAAAFTVGAAIWLVIMQWVASGLGGYVAGRLRTKWTGIHSDEVFFRDTAHGLLAWGVATILVAVVLVSGITTAVRTGTEAAATVAAGAAEGLGDAAAIADPTGYLVDRMLRSPTAPVTAEVRTEAARIIVTGAGEPTFPADDRTYLAQLVATATGIPQAEAEQRVSAAITDAQAAAAEVRETADEARAAAAAASLYTFISLLIGAFIACVAAAIGGRQRDEVPDIAV